MKGIVEKEEKERKTISSTRTISQHRYRWKPKESNKAKRIRVSSQRLPGLNSRAKGAGCPRRIFPDSPENRTQLMLMLISSSCSFSVSISFSIYNSNSMSISFASSLMLYFQTNFDLCCQCRFLFGRSFHEFSSCC